MIIASSYLVTLFESFNKGYSYLLMKYLRYLLYILYRAKLQNTEHIAANYTTVNAGRRN